MDNVEEIKGRLDASEVIGSYLQLKPAGTNFKGLCPFHHEKTPSFMVNDEKGIWHCFGCGEGGDIFSFVMKMEGLEFREALERLAQRAGVTIESTPQAQGRAATKQRIIEVLELATKYYQAVLGRSQKPLNYLRERGFKEAVIKEFRLGFAPDSTDSLVKALAKRGVKNEEMVKAGLARKRGSSYVDLFRNRLLVPLADSLGQTLGYTGRVLDDSLPKYLNTPQTLVFDKGRFLFGLNLAKDAIRTNDEAVVVEGNLDVVASHQAGVKQVIASSGTALTQHQLKALSRLTKNIKLAFDQDAAGLTATERSIPIAQNLGISLYIVKLKDAKDPDELIQKDPKLWQTALKRAPYVMDWLLDVLEQQYNLETVPGKKRYSDRIMGVLSKLPDPVEQEHYAQALANKVGVSPQAIMRKIIKTDNASEPSRSRAAAFNSSVLIPDENRTVEEALLAAAVAFADTRVSLQDLSDEHFGRPERQQIYRYLRAHAEVDFEKVIPKGLQSISNYVKILLVRGEDEYRDWAPLDRRIEAFSLANRLQTLFIKRTQKQLQEQLAAAEAAGDKNRKTELLKEFRDLSRQL